MARCQKIQIRKRQVCIGNMRDKIVLNTRSITAPSFDTVDFDETFVATKTVWAGVETQTGKTFFDGVETETPISHIIYVRFDSTVTSETWITFKSRRIDILKVEDLDERGEFMKLTCSDKGLESREASKI